MSDGWNRSVGRNVKDARLDLGWSQTELAAEMALYGYTWQQQTVQKIEKGSRPLKLREALALMSILGISLKELTDA
jgi:ribosome-binding protein aMBF1 (putative translation factor)